MNFQQLKGLVSYWLDDLNFGYFTQTQVGIWLNNAAKEVQKRIIKSGQLYYVACSKTPLVTNQSKYILPSNFLKINRLETFILNSRTVPTQLVPITLNQQNLVYRESTGEPEFYSIKKNAIVVYPTPNTAKYLRLDYTYAIPKMANDVDIPDVPEEYHELIALYAAQDGFIKDQRVPELLVKKIREYETLMDQDANERRRDAPRQVVETGINFENGYYW